MRHFLAVTTDDPHWGLIWRFMAETWIRVGELIDLRWGAVDLDNATVTIERTVTLDANRKRISSVGGKTNAARRVIPITEELADRLRQHRDLLRFLNRRIPQDENLVFPAPRTCTWMQQPSIANALVAACKRAGVPRLTPHGIRHTGGSIAYHNGVDVKTISERLGHIDVAFTLRIYMHTDAGQHRRAADRIGELLTGKPRAS